ncbi:hypothetical protein QVD17_17398 [Tagetes erecta]|uniref:Uncharacterized protein n=1 Tax=Tagetes erecta TaxID=13708 RepID=A0AAD8KYA8_TARER|nr:hypothetical protein QVD17_17398 [Tagetes erecta]
MSQAHVSYSCGSCGYELNLSSSNRVSKTTSEYRESVKKGLISFESIDQSRFSQIDKVPCIPIYLGCVGSKTKLMCRQCDALIGHGYKEGHGQCVFDARVGCEPSYKKILIKIRAIQPTDVASEARNGSGH